MKILKCTQTVSIYPTCGLFLVCNLGSFLGEIWDSLLYMEGKEGSKKEEVKEQMKQHQESRPEPEPNEEDRTELPEEFDTAL